MYKALNIKWYYILLLACLITLRFAYLDQDTPAYQLTNISQEDEPYYSISAVLKLCNDDGRTVKGFERTKSEGLDMYNRLLTYSSLKIFGNNYWGLRIPDVIVSLLFLLLMFSVFNSISPGNKLSLLLMGIMATNFYLFAFSRYNNPQIFSVLAVTWVIWLIVKYGFENPLPLIALGFFAAFAVFFCVCDEFLFTSRSGVVCFHKSNSAKKNFIAGVLSYRHSFVFPGFFCRIAFDWQQFKYCC